MKINPELAENNHLNVTRFSVGEDNNAGKNTNLNTDARITPEISKPSQSRN